MMKVMDVKTAQGIVVGKRMLVVKIAIVTGVGRALEITVILQKSRNKK